VKKFAKDLNPDFVVDLGDTLDLDYFSKFSQENLLTLVDCSWEEDVELLNSELDFWQTIAGKNYFWRLGNHDERAYIMGEKVPAFQKTLDYEMRFSLNKRGISFYRLGDVPLKISKCNFIHGWYTNQYHAKKHLERYSGNLIYGHVHHRQTHHKDLVAEGKTIHAWSLGCLCDKAPGYLRGRPSHWVNGFGVMYIASDDNFNFYPVDIIDEKFVFNGELYHA
jgi:hypothetical protein